MITFVFHSSINLVRMYCVWKLNHQYMVTLSTILEKKELGRFKMAQRSDMFSVNFVMGGTSTIISKSDAAPIERVKLLLQNQGQMIKRGQLRRP